MDGREPQRLYKLLEAGLFHALESIRELAVYLDQNNKTRPGLLRHSLGLVSEEVWLQKGIEAGTNDENSTVA
ncbi:MAG: hypothetical protein HPY90_12860 [Syntrophothermus sp.]|nr:hypothetical protein [Syntrophothermus sp.]